MCIKTRFGFEYLQISDTHTHKLQKLVVSVQDAIDLLRIPMRGDGAGLCGGLSCPDTLRLGHRGWQFGSFHPYKWPNINE